VRSSTSSSDERLPTGPWVKIWLCAIIVVAASLGGWEAYWRSRDWTPTVEAERETWVLARMRVQPASTVLVGTSRIAAAIDPEIWASALGTEPPVMLAAEGEGSLPVLSDLANDSTFRGHAVVEMLPTATFEQGSHANGPLNAYLRAYRESRESPARRWEAWLRTHVPSHFVFRRTELLPGRLVPALLGQRRIRQMHHALRVDQFRPVDFRLDGIAPDRAAVLDSARFRFIRRWAPPRTGPSLDSLTQSIASDVARIQFRGGRVTFIVFQGCGGRRLVEQEIYPTRLYWERLRSIPGVQMIDSDEYAEIARLPCYDGSHIDVRATPDVTRLVARLVAAKE
jgi:hypothetical protein